MQFKEKAIWGIRPLDVKLEIACQTGGGQVGGVSRTHRQDLLTSDPTYVNTMRSTSHSIRSSSTEAAIFHMRTIKLKERG